MNTCTCQSPYCQQCENKRIAENGVKNLIADNNQSIDLYQKAGVTNSNEDIYLIEYFFWKDEWFHETPMEFAYATKEEAIDCLNKSFEQNKNYNPELNMDEMKLSWNTHDNYRYYLITCTKIPHISSLKIT
jgi:hypothetical protein